MHESIEKVLTAQGRLATMWEQQAQTDENPPGDTRLAIGCENIDYRWKAEGMRQVIKLIRVGQSPIEAGETVKQLTRGWIDKHNARRPKDTVWRRWNGSADDSIDGVIHAVESALEDLLKQKE